MFARRLRFLAASFALLTMAAAQEREDNALDSARKDLKGLPNVQQSPVGRNSLPEVDLEMPLLSVPKSGDGSNRTSASPNGQPSQGWLLDALEERQTRGRFSPDRSKRPGDESLAKKNNASNPFDSYLRQWLTPRDQMLLLPVQRDLDESSARETEASFLRRSGAYDARPLLSNGRSGQRPGIGVRANPYLQDSPSADGPPTFAPLSAPAPATNQWNAPPTMVETAIPVSGPSGVSDKPVNVPPAEKFVAPTAPLVDERRYFPQLRKF